MRLSFFKRLVAGGDALESGETGWVAQPQRFAIAQGGSLFIALLILLGLSAPRTGAQMILKDFKFPIPFDRTNAPGTRIDRYKTLLTGQQVIALPKGLYGVTSMRIQNYQEDGKTNFIARAPECVLDSEKRIVSSTNRLELESPNGLYIEGVGFLCNLTNFILIISNQVRTYVRQQ